MLINNIDIKNFNTILTFKDIQTAEVVTYQDWLRNSFDPVIHGQKETYTPVKIKLLVEGNTEEETLILISNIVSISKKSTIKFDDIKWYFDCTLESKNSTQIANKHYELELNFKSSFKYTDEVTEAINRIATKTINVAGNLKTPCVVEITPTIDIIDITLEGLADDPIIIRNLKGGKTVILDGELQKVTVDGINKFSDVDLWDFPKLIPGSNTLKFSRNNCDIKIKYKPRWI